MNYIEFFEKEVPAWMRASNQKMQEVGFATDAYWQWCVQSMAEISMKYNNDRLVLNQFSIIFEWLEEKANGTV
ncbi:hypothetical protein [Streptococcus sp. 19428wC2_LYSM12]|uniref:hypothetical protein n=1 Tax=Streptococcus sp. 19428wC2_LYSM12 TaxID=2782470 RepID=UPI00260B3B76|nr:hypothetical protein [Streptococcus sp. 19428wC2_LYSM12]